MKEESMGLCHKGIKIKEEHYACISENNCCILLNPSKTLLTINLEKIPNLDKHCDCVVYYREPNSLNVEVFYVELKAIKDEYPDLTQDLDNKISNSKEILKSLSICLENYDIKIVKTHFIIVFLPKTLQTLGHPLRRKMTKIKGAFNYDHIFIRKSDTLLSNYIEGVDILLK